VSDPFDLELARERREGFLREAEERRLARASRVNTWTDVWFKFRGWRERRRTLLREEQERALAREAARVREAFAAAEGAVDDRGPMGPAGRRGGGRWIFSS
jgi:hypothetical protein